MPDLLKPNRNSLHSLAFILSLCLLIPLSWRWLYFQNRVPINGNVLREVYPNWVVTHGLLRQGEWPVWNPYRDMGEPHLADPKTMAAYPVSWILAGVNSFAGFLQGWFFFHTCLAALFAGALCFRWFHHKPAACLSALLAGFNGFFMAHGPYPNLFASAAWLPAIFYFHARKSWVPLAFCLALQWLAGYPPFSLLTLLALVIATGVLNEGSWVCLLAASLTAAAFAAYQWMPFLELLTHSTRHLFLDRAIAMDFSIPPGDLLKELLCPQWIWTRPQIHGDPAVVSFYLGALSIPLAVWAAWRGGRRERGLAFSAIAAILLCLGTAIPFYRSFFLLHFFRFPATWLLLVATSITFLAGAGLARLKNLRTAWVLVGVMAMDLVLFAQQPTAAWIDSSFLDTPPTAARPLLDGPFPTRLYHTPLSESAWMGLELRTLDDYLLMKEWLIPSLAVAWGGREANSYQVLRLKRTQAYLDQMNLEGPKSPRLNWAGISLAITLPREAGKGSRRTFVAVKVANPKPLVFIAEDASAGEILEMAAGPGRARASVNLARPATVVFSEVDYPGWSARVDGQPADLTRFAETFLAVRLGPGKHQVEWRYRSRPFLGGLALSFLALAGLGIYLLTFSLNKTGRHRLARARA